MADPTTIQRAARIANAAQKRLAGLRKSAKRTEALAGPVVEDGQFLSDEPVTVLAALAVLLAIKDGAVLFIGRGEYGRPENAWLGGADVAAVGSDSVEIDIAVAGWVAECGWDANFALLRAETATGGGMEYCADEDGENPELDAVIADLEQQLAGEASE